jgi:hypothetical protein
MDMLTNSEAAPLRVVLRSQRLPSVGEAVGGRTLHQHLALGEQSSNGLEGLKLLLEGIERRADASGSSSPARRKIQHMYDLMV